MVVGVLAFQGDFAEHMDILGSMGVRCMEVRSLQDLTKVDRLIIPGGESTVMARFLQETGVGEEIKKRAERAVKAERSKPLAVFGTCAGAIVLARKATGKNAPQPLGLIDIEVDRNAYGTQLQSFEAILKIKGFHQPIAVSFIRAPKITKVGKSVEVLASYKGFPVLVRQGSVLAATFHTEVRGESALHEFFLKM
ncbi:MAG: pyridoxal 5'-phosphate synthase glutaminase subunit PdxT [Candidatus Peribacteraceae bacterium]